MLVSPKLGQSVVNVRLVDEQVPFVVVTRQGQESCYNGEGKGDRREEARRRSEGVREREQPERERQPRTASW